jgi:hypothetical protein
VLNIAWSWSNKRQLGTAIYNHMSAWGSLCFLGSIRPLKGSDSNRGLTSLRTVSVYGIFEDNSLVISFAVTLRFHAVIASRAFLTALNAALSTCLEGRSVSTYRVSLLEP